MQSGTDTAERILDVAQLLVQRGGYHAFSYRDVSEHIGIRTASIHYHYPSKVDLVTAMLARVRRGFEASLAEIDAGEQDVRVKLQRFAAIFSQTLGAGDRLCPFCTIASGQGSVPAQLRQQVRAFWESAEAWLGATLRAGRAAGRLQFTAAPAALAGAWLAALEGTMIAATILQDRGRMQETIHFLMASVGDDDAPTPAMTGNP